MAGGWAQYLRGGEQTQPPPPLARPEPPVYRAEQTQPLPLPLPQTGIQDEPIAATAEIVRQILWPLMDYRVTGGYGQTGGPYPESGHLGLDMVPKGDDNGIYAPFDGRIVFNGFSRGYGNYLKIQHPDGTTTLYAHMAEPSPFAVGADVNQRQRIGTIGSTGYSTANHLHFEVYDAAGNRYDPLKWLGGESPFDSSFEPPTEPPTGQWTSDDTVNAVRYWSKKLGYSDSFAQFALAVAWGESGWDPYNDIVDVNGYPSRGIFQLNGRGRLPGFIAKYGEEGVANPYNQAEYNLPYLWKAYNDYGGDSGWASDPMSTLRNGWKYGQVAYWATDAKLKEALSQVAKVDTSSYIPTSQPSAQPSSTPSVAPWEQRSAPWANWLTGSFFGGLERQPVATFPFFGGLQRSPLTDVEPPPELDLVRQGLTNRTFPPPP